MQVEEITQILAMLTIIAQIIIFLLLVIKIIPRIGKPLRKYITYQNKLNFVYLVSFISMMGSLYYSEIAGYTPCKLCWYQRILMYPQVLLYLVAMVIKDRKIKIYGMVLSALGMALAGYHYLLQIGIIKTTSCSTVGFSISCSDRFTTTYGYITIPMMALSAFFLILLTWSLEDSGKKKV